MNAPIDPSGFEYFCHPVPPADFLALLRLAGLSPEAYRDAYGDLAERNWDAKQALAHLFNHGLDERRAAPLTLNPAALVALARLPIGDGAFRAKLLTYLGGHLFNQHRRPDGAAIADLWPAIQDLVREGGCPYLIAGDSHSAHYAVTGTRGDAWMLPIHLLCTGGSAAGLANPAARSGYGVLLRQAVQALDGRAGADVMPFLLQFGQVDLEFVYHYRRVRDGEPRSSLQHYRAFSDATLERYMRFVTNLFDPADRARVFLVSVFPPALSDAAWHQGYVNADIAERETATPVADLPAGIRSLEIADLRQRTDIHAYYNDRLREACDRLGFGYVDGMTPFLGADGVVDPQFIIPETAGAEHHLDGRRTYDAIHALIWRCIGAAGRPEARPPGS